jgi:hypothetical protein
LRVHTQREIEERNKRVIVSPGLSYDAQSYSMVRGSVAAKSPRH